MISLRLRQGREWRRSPWVYVGLDTAGRAESAQVREWGEQLAEISRATRSQPHSVPGAREECECPRVLFQLFDWKEGRKESIVDGMQ
jgi:hypothetical protein